MNKKNKLILTGVVTAAVMGVIPFSKTAFAQGGVQNIKDSDLVSKIASKFNLNQSDVQAVFDEERTAMQAERQKTFEENLSADVTAGKITEAQKQLIIEHQAANQTKMEEIRQMTDDTARKAAMDALREEDQKWASDNSIDMHYLGLGNKGGEGRGEMEMKGKGERRGMQNSTSTN